MAATIDVEKVRKLLNTGAAKVTDAVQQQAAAQQAQQAARAANPVSALYDNSTDYMALMQKYANQGDYSSAARAEQQRNSKITSEGLDTSLYTDLYGKYLPERRYNYDPTKNAEYAAAKAQQDAIFDKIMNRGAFSYDAESDPVYRQYREQYTTLGKNAMRDTMGQAAALTGGYGSTYAQQAGQQSYDAYLARLNDVLPELYNNAYSRYQAEGNELLNRYNMASGAADTAYNRDYTNWANRLNLELADEEAAYNRRLAADQTAYAQAQDAKTYLTNLITASGYTPTDDELKAAGMTRGQADALKKAYEQALAAATFSSGGGSGRSGGSGRRGRSGGSGSGSYTMTPQSNTGNKAAQAEAQKKLLNQCSLSLSNMAKYGGSKQEMRRELQRWVSQGLSQSEANRLAKLYGLDQDDTPAKSSSGGGKGGARGGGNTYTKGGY